MNIIPQIQDNYKGFLKLDIERLELEDRVIFAQSNYNELVKQLEQSEEYKLLQQYKQELVNKQKEIDEINALVIETMKDNGIDSVELGNKTLKLKKTPGSLKIENEDLIPEKYKKEKITYNCDKVLIKKELENGVVLPGCEIVYTYKLEFKSNE